MTFLRWILPELKTYHGTFFSTSGTASRINNAKKIINNTLYAYIARNILGEEAFYKLLLRDDETLRKAQEVLADEKSYNRLLSGQPTESTK